MISIDLSKLKDVFSLKNHNHSYDDLSNKPSLKTVATSGAYNDLTGTPTLSSVATSGSYSDLSGTPNLDTIEVVITYSDDSTDTVNIYIEPDNS